MSAPKIPLKGEAEFAQIRNTTTFQIADNGDPNDTWNKYQADVIVENRNSNPTVNAIGGAGPWGIAAVVGGDYWATGSLLLRLQGGGGDSPELNFGFYVTDVLKASSGYHEYRLDDGHNVMLSWSTKIALLADEFVDFRLQSKSVADDIDNRADALFSFFSLVRIGDTES